MEKPPSLDKVIEKLEKLDIQEWSTSDYYPPHSYSKDFWVLTARTGGLVFNIKSFYKEGIIHDLFNVFNDEWYVISIRDEHQKAFIEYKEDSKKGRINQFYKKLCKNLQEFKKKDLNKRIQDFIYGLEPEKKDVEKIIEKLEGIDFGEWETDLKFDEKKYKPKHPSFVTKIGGLSIRIQKGILEPYTLRIENLEGDTGIVYGENENSDFKIRRAERELMKRLYKKLCKESYKGLEKNKEKEFEDTLNNFLTN